MSDYDVALMTGVAVVLDTAGVGVWRPDTPYVEGERAITLDALPQDPLSAISLAAYTLTDSPTQYTMLVGLQVICREEGPSSVPARDSANAVFRLLHDRTHVQVGGLHVTQILRQSSVSGGRETNGAWRIIQNFYLNLDAPPTAP